MMRSCFLLPLIIALSASLLQDGLARSLPMLAEPSPAPDSPVNPSEAPSPAPERPPSEAPSLAPDQVPVTPSETPSPAPESPSPAPQSPQSPDNNFQGPSESPQAHHVPGLPTHPIYPWLPPFAREALECWAPICHVKGCTVAIMRAFFTSNADHIQKSCCQAIAETSADCANKMFLPAGTEAFKILQKHCAAHD